MSLQLKAIDRIFERLTATYGRDFTSRWEGLDQNTIKSSWSHELSGFENALPMIGWALENLPERAPNVIEFRSLCRKAPAVEKPRLEAPKFDKAIAAMVTEGLRKTIAATPTNHDPRAWAHAILGRHKDGHKISPAVVQMARQGLGMEA